MGNSTWLDILGSMITFGLLLIIVLRLNAGANESSSAYFASYMLQTNMLTLTVMLEDDLKHVGAWYAPTVNDPTAVRTAAANQFSFIRDSDGKRIDWIVGDSTEMASTPNPHDRYVYRNVNGAVSRMNLGVTRMTFTYWRIDDPTLQVTGPYPLAKASFGNIGPIDVSIVLESPYKRKQQYMMDTTEYEMYWRQIRSVARTTLVQIPP
jgi:hypothetical protein